MDMSSLGLIRERVTHTCVTLGGLTVLCQDLGIDDENLDGATLETKAASLVRHCDSRGILGELVHMLERRERDAPHSLISAQHPLYNIPDPRGWPVLRACEIAQLMELLRDERNRPPLLVIKGKLGMGKMALACWAAYYCRQEQLFDVLFHWSADYQPRALGDLTGDFLRLLGVPRDHAAELARERPQDELIARLQERRCLLVVSKVTAEHHQEIISALAGTPAPPSCTIITTTASVAEGFDLPQVTGFTADETREYIRRRAADKQNEFLRNLKDRQIVQLHKASDGCPAALSLAVNLLITGMFLADVLDRLEAGDGLRPLCEPIFDRLSQPARAALRAIFEARDGIDGAQLLAQLGVDHTALSGHILPELRSYGLVHEDRAASLERSRFHPASGLLQRAFRPILARQA